VDFDVAILGAGPTGLTLANLLGTMGIRTVLIERNPATVPAPRAVSIDDECLRTMQAAGVVDAVVKDIALDYGAHYFTAKGVCFAKVEPKDREYGYPRRSAFSQVKLEATLREELKRFSHVTALFGTNCASFREDDEGVTLFSAKKVAPRATFACAISPHVMAAAVRRAARLVQS
jgi:3-(3-hydroxy-phenyl)propionate hydroxylase